MTEKRFKIVNDCGDYHLMNGDEQLGYDLCSYSMRKANWNNVVDLLNEQDERIQELLSCNHGLAQKQIRMLDKLIQLEKEKESWKYSACHDTNLKSMLSFEIGKLTETKDVDSFLDFYYKHFYKINGDVE